MLLLFVAAVSTVSGDCTDGDMRLVGGSNVTVGRVEVCVNDAWGTVCNSGFGTNEAKVICRALEFDPGISATLPTTCKL